MLRLIQMVHPLEGRRVAGVDGDRCVLISGQESVYGLAHSAIRSGRRLADEAARLLSGPSLDYGPIYEGRSPWRLLPSFDHPDEPARCLVSGTGLTHLASARNRQAMHGGDRIIGAPVTDSMRMYQWGVEGGRPAQGAIGVQPEWFYKGSGTILRAHGEALETPTFGDDGGEEPEIAGVYLVDPDGRPRRVGLTNANEFSDHVMEKKNYLYLAPSKLRACAIGPELIVDAGFAEVSGKVSIERAGKTVWSKDVATGEARMSHALANLEHHHFKYPAHRRPGDVHVHFLGADAFSFGEGVSLKDGDIMAVSWDGFGRALRNPLKIEQGEYTFIPVQPV